MKPSHYLFLYLNIYCCFSFGINAQETTLTITAERPISQGLIDSLQIPESFSEFETLRKKTDTIYLTFQSMGYIDAELRQLKQENDSSYIADFYLGNKYETIKVYYSPKDFTKKELQQVTSDVKDGYFIISIENLSTSLTKLTTIRNQKGNAFARLNLTEIEKDTNNALTATLVLDNGRIRTIDSIVVKGYDRFPKSFLRYYAGIRKGRTFNKMKLIAQNENLNSLGFVSTSKPPEVLFRKDTTIVFFYLEKLTNNLFDGILGFATDEKTQKLEFNGYLNLELNNNLNYGEQFLLNYTADGKEQVQFRAKAILPYLFMTPFGISGELKIFKQDSSFVTTEQQFRTIYQVNPTSSAYIGYRSYDSSNLLDEIVAGTPIEDFESKFVTAGVSYTKHQNRSVFPIKSFLSLDFGVGSRKRKDQTENQYRGEVVATNIFQLNKKNSIFVQNTTNALFSNSFLINELFRFGGINSIRGFDENSIDASLFSVINTEYRYQFNDGIFAHSIIDIAYFENQTLSLKQQLYSFGIGLGLTTKAGLFRLNVANGSTETQNFNLSNTKIHISLSSRF